MMGSFVVYNTSAFKDSFFSCNQDKSVSIDYFIAPNILGGFYKTAEKYCIFLW